MKTIFLNSFFFFFFISATFSQEITEENYKKADRVLWETFERDCDNISKLIKSNPDKTDSLNIILNQLFENVNKNNCDTAIKYATVPSGLQRLFWVRTSLTKDTLQLIYDSLTDDMQESDYGKSILLHIKEKQVEEGDKYSDFEAIDTLGNKIKFSSFRGDYILLIYAGLDCMGKSGRDFLNDFYEKTQRDNFQIVVYSKTANLDQLQGLSKTYGLKYPMISDFLNDHSPMKIKYGFQATPTSILIDKEGIVILKTLGLPEEELTRLKSENKI